MEKSAWKIKVKSSTGTWVDLKLPVLVGSSATADIVIHSPVVPGQAKLLTADCNKLWCWDIQRQVYLEDPGLQPYGIEIKGPFLVGKGGRPELMQAVIQKEHNWLASLPVRWQGALGAHLPRAQRWGWFGAIGMGILMLFVAVMKPSRATVKDRSRSPIKAHYGQVDDTVYGQDETFRELRHGVTISFEIPKATRGRDHALELMMGGLEKSAELEVVVNGQKIFSNSVRPECVDELCQEAIFVPGEFTNSKTIDFILVHRLPNSQYMVTNILFDELRSLSMQERMSAARRLDLAKRMYNERAVTYQNLITAKKEIKQVLEIVRLRSNVGTMRDEAISLDEDLEKEIVERTEDMWFQSRRFIRLGEYRDAINQLRGLLDFYPDPAHPRYSQISSAIKQLEEVL